MTAYIEVIGWGDFQHYKDRDPPWIKLHRKVLDNYEFSRLQDASKAHLMGLWLLAARHHNQIPADPDWIAQRIGATSPVDIETLVAKGFIKVHGEVEQNASNGLAKCPSRADARSRETEAERETETEASTPAREEPPNSQRSRMLARFEFDDAASVTDFLEAIEPPPSRGRWIAVLDAWSEGRDVPPVPKVTPPDIAGGLRAYLADETIDHDFKPKHVLGYCRNIAQARASPRPPANGASGARRGSIAERNYANAIAAQQMPPLPGDS